MIDPPKRWESAIDSLQMRERMQALGDQLLRRASLEMSHEFFHRPFVPLDNQMHMLG